MTQSCDTKHKICNSATLPCRPGAERTCPSTFPKAEGIGRCRSGKQTCEESGVWSPCVGVVEPGKELCNNIDDDCNGKVDDGLNCIPKKEARIFNDINCRPIGSQKSANWPSCSAQEACGCLVDDNDVIYVCAGEKGESPRWMPKAQVTERCHHVILIEGGKYMCGKEELVCDQCPNQPVAWRKITGNGCRDGVLTP